MAWQKYQYRLVSDGPMLMKNGQTADPLNPYAKEMKAISGKRKKTDADYEQLAKLEFQSALYINGEGPVLPARNMDATILNAAKKLREGPLAKAGIFCAADAPLEYEGPKTREELWQNEDFRHVSLVRVQQARLARTRPVFREWSATVTINVETELVNISQVDQWMQIAGTQIGLCDWRPVYGRFTAERIQNGNG